MGGGLTENHKQGDQPQSVEAATKSLEQMVTLLRGQFSTISTVLGGVLIALLVLWFLPIEDEAGARFLASKEYRLAKEQWQSSREQLKKLKELYSPAEREDIAAPGQSEVEAAARDGEKSAAAMELIRDSAVRFVTAATRMREVYGEELKEDKDKDKDKGKDGDEGGSALSLAKEIELAEAMMTHVAGMFGQFEKRLTGWKQEIDADVEHQNETDLDADARKAVKLGMIRPLKKRSASYGNPGYIAMQLDIAARLAEHIDQSVRKEVSRLQIEKVLATRIGFKLPFAEQPVPMRKVGLTWALVMTVALAWGVTARHRCWSLMARMEGMSSLPHETVKQMQPPLHELPWWTGSWWVPTGDDGHEARRGWMTVVVGVATLLVVARMVWLELAHFHLILLGTEPPSIESADFTWNYASLMALGLCAASALIFVFESGRTRTPANGMAAGRGMTTRTFVRHTLGLCGGWMLAGALDCSLSRSRSRAAQFHTPRFVLHRPRRRHVEPEEPDAAGKWLGREVAQDNLATLHYCFPKEAFRPLRYRVGPPFFKRFPVPPPAGPYLLRPRKPGRDAVAKTVAPDDLIPNINELLAQSASAGRTARKEPQDEPLPPHINHEPLPLPLHINLSAASAVCEYNAVMRIRDGEIMPTGAHPERFTREGAVQALKWMLCSIRHRSALQARQAGTKPDYRAFDLAARLAGYLDDVKVLNELRRDLRQQVENLDKETRKKSSANSLLNRRLDAWQRPKWQKICKKRLNPIRWQLPGEAPG